MSEQSRSFKSESGGPSENNESQPRDLGDESFSDLVMGSMHLLTDENFSESALRDIQVDNDKLKELCVARVSHKIRKLLRNFGNSNSSDKIIVLANQKCIENPCTQIQPLAPLYQNFPNTSKFGLFASRDIREGEFVIVPVPALLTSPEECGRDRFGLLIPNVVLFSGLQSDFSYYNVVDTSGSRKRKRDTGPFLERRKLRAIEFNKNGQVSCRPEFKYESEDEANSDKSAYDKYDICIDMRDSTAELKCMRRNCVPNCTIRYVFLHQRMEIFITAQKDIKKGEELTLPHDYDSNMSAKVIQCAHPYDANDICLHEKERQETIRKYATIMAGRK